MMNMNRVIGVQQGRIDPIWGPGAMITGRAPIGPPALYALVQIT